MEIYLYFFTWPKIIILNTIDYLIKLARSYDDMPICHIKDTQLKFVYLVLLLLMYDNY